MGVEDKYVLHYFDARGLAEPIRILLTYTDAKWEDKRIPMPTFPTHIPEEILAIAPFGQVPVLEVGEKILSQSQAIMRYLAKQFNLVGQDNWEEAQCDEIGDATVDMYRKWQLVYQETDKENHEELKTKTKEDSARYLKRFNQVLEENGSGYLVGKEMTWADIFLAHYVDNIEIIYNVDLIGDYPAVKELVKTVYGKDKIKEWVESRPKTLF